MHNYKHIAQFLALMFPTHCPSAFMCFGGGGDAPELTYELRNLSDDIVSSYVLEVMEDDEYFIQYFQPILLCLLLYIPSLAFFSSSLELFV